MLGLRRGKYRKNTHASQLLSSRRVRQSLNEKKLGCKTHRKSTIDNLETSDVNASILQEFYEPPGLLRPTSPHAAAVSVNEDIPSKSEVDLDWAPADRKANQFSIQLTPNEETDDSLLITGQYSTAPRFTSTFALHATPPYEDDIAIEFITNMLNRHARKMHPHTKSCDISFATTNDDDDLPPYIDSTPMSQKLATPDKIPFLSYPFNISAPTSTPEALAFYILSRQRTPMPYGSAPDRSPTPSSTCCNPTVLAICHLDHFSTAHAMQPYQRRNVFAAWRQAITNTTARTYLPSCSATPPRAPPSRTASVSPHNRAAALQTLHRHEADRKAQLDTEECIAPYCKTQAPPSSNVVTLIIAYKAATSTPHHAWHLCSNRCHHYRAKLQPTAQTAGCCCCHCCTVVAVTGALVNADSETVSEHNPNSILATSGTYLPPANHTPLRTATMQTVKHGLPHLLQGNQPAGQHRLMPPARSTQMYEGTNDSSAKAQPPSIQRTPPAIRSDVC